VEPQSTSVSVPFLTPSEQLAAWQMLPTHTPLWQSLAAKQSLPLMHLLQVAPPQSMSVSVPFLIKSAQLDAWQTLPMHTPLWQSPADEHVLPVAHLEQLAPPQSTSVSVPFFTVSMHVGAWHTFGLPEQTPLWQSVLTLQKPPTGHLAHVPPPQSTSVSAPFLTTSVQLGDWQMAPMHTPLWQSPPVAHVLPAAHLPQLAPPQSVSVSVPFFTLSPHVGAWHLSGLPEHTPLWQSEPAAHVLLVGHFAHVPPPQSVSVSAPFFTASVQVAA
jgi:hypothetical protein